MKAVTWNRGYLRTSDLNFERTVEVAVVVFVAICSEH